MAVVLGRVELAHLLVEHSTGADDPMVSWRSPDTSCWCYGGKELWTLLKRYSGSRFPVPLDWAVFHGHFAVAKVLVDHGHDISGPAPWDGSRCSYEKGP